MAQEAYDSLSGATNALAQQGYTEQFKTENNHIHGLRTKKAYLPEELVIHKTFRFEGQSSPSDNSLVLALESNDGIKGLLVMAYGAYQGHDAETIQAIPKK